MGILTKNEPNLFIINNLKLNQYKKDEFSHRHIISGCGNDDCHGVLQEREARPNVEQQRTGCPTG
jgi:hypothetical protein